MCLEDKSGVIYAGRENAVARIWRPEESCRDQAEAPLRHRDDGEWNGSSEHVHGAAPGGLKHAQAPGQEENNKKTTGMGRRVPFASGLVRASQSALDPEPGKRENTEDMATKDRKRMEVESRGCEALERFRETETHPR